MWRVRLWRSFKALRRRRPGGGDWDRRRGLFYWPVKQQLTLRLDSDIVAWFKARIPGGEGYQTSIDAALREYVAQREAK